MRRIVGIANGHDMDAVILGFQKLLSGIVDAALDIGIGVSIKALDLSRGRSPRGQLSHQLRIGRRGLRLGLGDGARCGGLYRVAVVLEEGAESMLIGFLRILAVSGNSQTLFAANRGFVRVHVYHFADGAAMGEVLVDRISFLIAVPEATAIGDEDDILVVLVRAGGAAVQEFPCGADTQLNIRAGVFIFPEILIPNFGRDLRGPAVTVALVEGCDLTDHCGVIAEGNCADIQMNILFQQGIGHLTNIANYTASGVFQITRAVHRQHHIHRLLIAVRGDGKGDVGFSVLVQIARQGLGEDSIRGFYRRLLALRLPLGVEGLVLGQRNGAVRCIVRSCAVGTGVPTGEGVGDAVHLISGKGVFDDGELRFPVYQILCKLFVRSVAAVGIIGQGNGGSSWLFRTVCAGNGNGGIFLSVFQFADDISVFVTA